MSGNPALKKKVDMRIYSYKRYMKYIDKNIENKNVAVLKKETIGRILENCRVKEGVRKNSKIKEIAEQIIN